MSNKNLWKTIKPLLTNKEGFTNDFIILDKEGKVISNVKALVELFYAKT